MFIMRGTNLIIHPETDIYFVTGLLPQGEALRYPLPTGRVNIDRFWRRHCVGAPLTEGCTNIVSMTDVAEQCALAIIVQLVGLFAPYRASGLQVGFLCRLRGRHFFDFARFCFDGMVSQLNKVQRGSKSFAYASILCSIMYERVMLLRPMVVMPAGGPREPRMR